MDNKRTRERFLQEEEKTENLEPMAAFREFYQLMNQEPLSEEEEQVMQQVINQVIRGEVQQ